MCPARAEEAVLKYPVAARTEGITLAWVQLSVSQSGKKGRRAKEGGRRRARGEKPAMGSPADLDNYNATWRRAMSRSPTRLPMVRRVKWF